MGSHRRTFVKRVGAGVAAGSLGLTAGCTSLTGGGEQTFEMRYANPAGESSPMGVFAKGLAEKVDDRSDGTLQIDVFHGSELGTQPEQVEATIAGNIAMGSTGWGIIGAHFKDIGIYETGYLFDSIQHAIRAMDPEQTSLTDELYTRCREETGIRILGGYAFTTRNVATRAGQEIRKPSDMSGLDIRVPNGKVYETYMNGMGGNPVTIPFSEAMQSLSTGEIDGLEHGYNIILSLGVPDVADTYSLTEHIHHVIPVYIGEYIWEDMSDEQREIMETATRDQIEEHYGTFQDNLQANKEEVASKMNLVEDVDRDAFAKRTLAEFRKTFPEWEDMIDTLRNA